MAKVKICPSCGFANQPGILECTRCEADLTGVKLTEGVLQRAAESGQKEALRRETVESSQEGMPRQMEMDWMQEDMEYVRICDCGFQNRVSRRKCERCGEDLSDIAPVPRCEQGKPENYELCSHDGACHFPVPEGETRLGREYALKEYLSGKPFVSRLHARLLREGSHIYIENLNRTNYTFVNDRRIEGKTELSAGDVIGLGGIRENGNFQPEAAYFSLRKCLEEEV